MRYLMRDAAPLTETQWARIDEAVVAEASRVLVGRRFLTLAGPFGGQIQNVALDQVHDKTDAAGDFWGQAELTPLGIGGRRFLQVPTLYADFLISWRDIESENGAGVQAAVDAAMLTARREDDLVFHGDKALGLEGLLTAKGVNKVALSDWDKGENPIRDVARALEILDDKSHSGRRALVVSSDLYAKLHRIQPGTGIMEIDRVRGLVGGGAGGGSVFKSSRIGKNTALLAYCDPHNMDLVVGQDLITAYMGNDQLDHLFRVMETAVPRIKRPSAICVFA